MIAYFVSCVVVAINVVLYIVTHLFLELYYLPKKGTSQNMEPRPKAWNSNLELFLTTLPSLYLWLLFFVVPFSLLIGGDLFYSTLPIPVPTELQNIVQLIGLAIIFIGTLVAILGRLSRGKDAISWGTPTKMITRGIFNYIRHPLYSSYILLFIGFQLTFSTFFMTPLLLGIGGYYLTALYEEELLIDTFGEHYKDYKTRTKMFIPLLF